MTSSSRTTRGLPWLVTSALAGCGNLALESPESTHSIGSRLTPLVYMSGGVEVAPTPWLRDRVLDTDCEPAYAADGRLRCVPLNAPGVRFLYYSDDACTRAIACEGAGCAGRFVTDSAEGRGSSPPDCGETPSLRRVFRRGVPLSMARPSDTATAGSTARASAASGDPSRT